MTTNNTNKSTDEEKKNDSKQNGLITNENKSNDTDEEFLKKFESLKDNNIEDDYSDDDDCERLDIGTLKHNELEKIYEEEELIQKHCTDSSWSNADATSIHVRRGPNYLPGSGQKEPSRKALYSVIACDAYQTKKKIHKIWKYVDIKKYIKKYKLFKYDMKNGITLPPLVVVNIMIPGYEPSIMGGPSDGGGFQLIVYARLSDHVIKEYADIKNNKKTKSDLTNSITLFSNFIHSDKKSKLRERFKCIAKVMNPNKCEINMFARNLMNRYNGKPFLCRTSSTFYHVPGNYFGADIDAHVFGYVSRKGLFYMKDGLKTIIFDSGFVIEGAKDNELPEQMLFLTRFSKLGFSNATPWKYDTKEVDKYLKNKKDRDILHHRDIQH